MAFLGGLAGIAQVASIGGTILSVAGAIEQGQEQKAQYEYQQKVAEQQADEAKAASQRDAAQRYKEGQLILSQQRAAIAGTGGSVSDPSVIDLMQDTQKQTALAADTEIYKGEQQSRGYTDQAKVAGINADNAMSAAWLNAGSNLFSGISSFYSRFGQQQRITAPASGSTAPLYG